jgi:hypothetical protein
MQARCSATMHSSRSSSAGSIQSGSQGRSAPTRCAAQSVQTSPLVPHRCRRALTSPLLERITVQHTRAAKPSHNGACAFEPGGSGTLSEGGEPMLVFAALPSQAAKLVVAAAKAGCRCSQPSQPVKLFAAAAERRCSKRSQSPERSAGYPRASKHQMRPNPSIERTSTGLAHSAPQVYVPLRGPSRFRPAHVKR